MNDSIYPVEHMSFSGLLTYFKSPRKFWNQYVNHEKFKKNLTTITGRAWHKGLESYYRGMDNPTLQAVLQLTTEIPELPDEERPTTDELGKLIIRLEDNLKDYFSIKKDWKASQWIEKTVVAPPPVEGTLKLKGQMDLINDQESIVDHKYVRTFDCKPVQYHYPQAWFYFYLYKELVGKEPICFIVSEYKNTKNRDKTSQYQETIITYDQEWIKKIDKWYADMCMILASQRRFPPNPFQIYEADDWQDYLNSPIEPL